MQQSPYRSMLIFSALPISLLYFSFMAWVCRYLHCRQKNIFLIESLIINHNSFRNHLHPFAPCECIISNHFLQHDNTYFSQPLAFNFLILKQTYYLLLSLLWLPYQLLMWLVCLACTQFLWVGLELVPCFQFFCQFQILTFVLITFFVLERECPTDFSQYPTCFFVLLVGFPNGFTLNSLIFSGRKASHPINFYFDISFSWFHLPQPSSTSPIVARRNRQFHLGKQHPIGFGYNVADIRISSSENIFDPLLCFLIQVAGFGNLHCLLLVAGILFFLKCLYLYL